ncbi:hypothetical protein EV182_000238 [Spiromyces aspiralis]|uniref:Uncharacterized protein n=1 Tax=Spiromyces aspiralis TaxID=68401 RepID=A0ACC1HX25_9FUNG|nr:hypothetical protein EV182_000238 [Spiromyces aspiralis]
MESNEQWAIPFVDFFNSIGLSDVARSVETEAIVFSCNNHKDKLINALMSLNSKIEIGQRIEKFIEEGRAVINESNKVEFLESPYPYNEGSSARVNVSSLDRSVQMIHGVVNNAHTILSRSNPNDGGSASQAQSDPVPTEHDQETLFKERIGNIQEHLDIILRPQESFTLTERIKLIEDTIINLERDFPTWSYIHFNQPGRSEGNHHHQQQQVMSRPAPPRDVIRFTKDRSGAIVRHLVSKGEDGDPANQTQPMPVSASSAQPDYGDETVVGKRRRPEGGTPPTPVKVPTGPGKSGMSSLTKSILAKLQQKEREREQHQAAASQRKREGALGGDGGAEDRGGPKLDPMSASPGSIDGSGETIVKIE